VIIDLIPYTITRKQRKLALMTYPGKELRERPPTRDNKWKYCKVKDPKSY